MKVLIFSLALLRSLRVSTGGCVINIQTDLPTKNDPVYFVRSPLDTLELAYPINGTIELQKNEEFDLACTGSRSTLIETDLDFTETKCVQGSTLNVAGKDLPTAELNCSSRSVASLLITNDICYDRQSNIILLGFPVQNKWFPIVQTCHNIEGAFTNWAKHVLYGSELDFSVKDSNRPGFSRGDSRLFKGFDPDDAYTQKNQAEVFNEIYGNISSEYIIYRKSYLSRGHLAPDADFLFGSWQMATYFFVNTIPQWQSINGGNWVTVENHARKLAENLNHDLNVVTGAHGILKLADDNGDQKEAFLAGDRLPVPEIVWKLLQDPTDTSCIVLLSVNNPFLKSPPQTICPDICSETGWPDLQDDLSKGYVYCCDYSSFKAAIPQAPNSICTSRLIFK